MGGGAVGASLAATRRLLGSRRSDRGGFWRWYALVLGAMMVVPLIMIALGWLSPQAELWSHMTRVMLPELVRNTLLLLLGVGTLVLLLGVSLAWLTAMCEFPGRRLFDWALMLPLAVPAYVQAFVFVGLFDYAGPVQSWLRAMFGGAIALPPIRSTGGVILVMALVLYPYVYMLARAAFVAQGQSVLDAARVQGLTQRQTFFRVALPMARPAIVAGVSLALMETLADFGAVAIFNYSTFTTAIYRAWFGFFSLAAAAQLASLLLLFVIVALTLERRARGNARFFQATSRGRARRLILRGGRAWLASGFAALILGLGFVLPLIQLLYWASGTLGDIDARFLALLQHTLMLGVIAAVLTVLLALLLAYAKRQRTDWLTRRAVAASTLGYALPGSVLAVGIMLTFTWVDGLLMRLPWLESGPWLTGTVFALICAYITRFMAVAYGSVDSALEQIRPSLGDAARSLGAGHGEVIRRVYVPMLRPGLLTAGLLVCVDVMKEMPATLLLRPFGWDTLAVRIFEFTFEGQWERAALPAVTLVLVGLLPVILLVTRSAGTSSKQPIPPTLEQG
jgi:iron(III) transport system permease protein